uniref:Uncharacterized protein n=1 Tax=Plectus sambesii TaxID=2011161 RepID=A0A914UXE0_9BILA
MAGFGMGLGLMMSCGMSRSSRSGCRYDYRTRKIVPASRPVAVKPRASTLQVIRVAPVPRTPSCDPATIHFQRKVDIKRIFERSRKLQRTNSCPSF